MKKCLHCGKDIAEEALFCAHCGKSVNEAPVDKSIEAIKSAVKGEITPLKESIEAVDKRVKAIEALPLRKETAHGIIVPETYRGYKIHDQGQALRERTSKDPIRFKVLSDMGKFNEFAKFMIDVKFALRGDLKAQQKLQELREKATDMSEGSDSVGGYTVPVEYEPELVQLAKDVSFALQNCTVLPMGRQTLKIPTELTRVSVTWEDEAASIDESNPTFGQVTLTAKKLAGLTSGISSELLDDTMIDIVGLLTEQFMYAIGLELDNQVLNGTGSPVSGVLTAACGYSVSLSSGSTNFSAITADALSEMIYKLSEEDAAQAVFVYNRLIQHYIRTKKDSNGQYIWQKPEGGRPGTIWETPYFQSVKATGTTGSTTAFVALGNWKKFYIGRRLGTMQFASDPYTNFATDEIRYRVITRWGLAIARSTAFCRLLTA